MWKLTYIDVITKRKVVKTFFSKVDLLEYQMFLKALKVLFTTIEVHA